MTLEELKDLIHQDEHEEENKEKIKKLEKMIKEVDKNRNKKVDYDEFLDMMYDNPLKGDDRLSSLPTPNPKKKKREKKYKTTD